ncbi:MAG: 4Fe-4S dicluster domain-containing protein [Desulfobacteraceae bacterium]|nr:4Fe-4S dicluster domain-containing protein [Desulfobacteraceae bacterium]
MDQTLKWKDFPMPQNDLYDKLADLFNQIGFGSRKSPELINLLKSLFNEQEAQIALNLSPFAPEPPVKVAERLGKDPDGIAETLDCMADKGLIYASKKGDENWFKTIQLVPGIFELQFMKGEVTDRAIELAKLFDAYAHAGAREQSQQPVPPSDKLPVNFARVIPIEKSVSSDTTVFPYEEIAKYIDAAKDITVSVCYCRHEKRLLDKGCNFPDDVCLQLGSFSRFVEERGFGRRISKEEAHEIIKKSADAGLIHTASNTMDGIDFICNCCTCCCGILRGVSQFNLPVRTVSSNYEVKIDGELCSACGECVTKCQMAAVSLENESPEINLERCIGCGVCVHHCPTGALTLAPRTDFIKPPANFRELVQKQADSRK